MKKISSYFIWVSELLQIANKVLLKVSKKGLLKASLYAIIQYGKKHVCRFLSRCRKVA